MKRLPERIVLSADREVVRRPAESWKAFLRRAARTVGNFPCGGAGTCGRCSVRLMPPDWVPLPGSDDLRLMGEDQVRQGWRLLCGLLRQAEIDLPAMAAQAGDPAQGLAQMVDHYRAAGEQPSPQRGKGEDPRSRVVSLSGHCWTLAIDLGTTTLGGALVPLDRQAQDARRGAAPEMLSDAVMNGQAEVGGPDVMSRIARASESPEFSRALTKRLRDSVGQLTRRLLQRFGVEPRAVERVVLCGNTTMQYFFLGREVSGLGQYPFEPTDRGPFDLYGPFPGLPGSVRQWLFPVPGGFVGGDIIAGLLVTRPITEGRRTLFMDLGTNGELAVYDGRQYYAAGTAAGPAFEGARIACGSPAVRGAIERVRLTSRGLSLGVIGRGRARSLCGSGLVDLAAVLLRLGGITPDGRLREPDDPLARRVPQLAGRLYVDRITGELRFRVAGRGGGDVWLGQRDVREFQLAVGAIRAGARLLLGLSEDRNVLPQTVIIAGGYGFHLDVASAAAVGLIPAGVPLDAVVRPGNTALAGAALVAEDPSQAAEAERLAGACTVINLADLDGFAEAFAESMTLPNPRGDR